jgi:ABC-type transport system substrate-binding protein
MGRDLRALSILLFLTILPFYQAVLVANGWVQPGVTLGVIAVGGVTSLPITPTMFDPYAPSNLMFDGLGGQWFLQPLAYLDIWNSSLFPDIAQSWSYNPNNLTLIIHIRPGLTWFNGQYTIP